MFKKIRFKIIIGIAIVGILIILAFGTYNVQLLKNSNIDVEMTQAISNNIKIAIGVSIFAIIILTIILTKILSKYVIYPVDKLIKSGDKTISTKEDVIDVMTAELKEKLSEVSTQKNQIETILLHMTDGIIAFNREGEIILLNPAAKQLLSIRPEDNTFDDIFQKGTPSTWESTCPWEAPARKQGI